MGGASQHFIRSFVSRCVSFSCMLRCVRDALFRCVCRLSDTLTRCHSSRGRHCSNNNNTNSINIMLYQTLSSAAATTTTSQTVQYDTLGIQYDTIGFTLTSHSNQFVTQCRVITLQELARRKNGYISRDLCRSCNL